MEISCRDSHPLLTVENLPKSTIIENLQICLFFLTIFLVFVSSPVDNDMPWHLKTGEYIFANMHLPTIDPFSYAKTNVSTLGHFILTQYWLAQVIFWLVFSTFGVNGIVFFIASIFVLIAFLLFSMIRKVNRIFAMLVIGLYLTYFINGFNTLRPQIFSFLFSTLIIYFFQKYKKTNCDLYLIIVPIIFLLWANMHGGFIFGITLFCIFLASEILYIIIPTLSLERDHKKSFKKILITAIVSLIFCYINPNGYEAFRYALRSHSTTVFSSIMEYQSPLQLDSLPLSNMINFWLTIPLSFLVVFLGMMRKKIFPAFIVLFTLGMAFTAIRYFPLLIIVTTSAIGQISNRFFFKISKIKSYAINIVIIILLICCSFLLFKKIDNNTFNFSISSYNAAAAINFLKSNKISGNIYGSYNKSSHLILGLFPESKVFWSSNFISAERFKDGLIIGGEGLEKFGYAAMYNLFPPEDKVIVDVSFSENDKRNYENWLKTINNSGTEIIIHEALNIVSGEPSPLVFLILTMEEWKLIYADGEVLIFLRNIPKFEKTILEFKKSKEIIFDQLIIEGMKGSSSNSANFPAITALGYLLKGDSGNYTRELLSNALEEDPHNQFANIGAMIFKNKKLLNNSK